MQLVSQLISNVVKHKLDEAFTTLVSDLLHWKVFRPIVRVVFEAEASKAGGLSHPSLSPFPPLPLSIPPKFSDKPVGGKVRSSEGEVPRLPPYKYHPA